MLGNDKQEIGKHAFLLPVLLLLFMAGLLLVVQNTDVILAPCRTKQL